MDKLPFETLIMLQKLGHFDLIDRKEFEGPTVVRDLIKQTELVEGSES